MQPFHELSANEYAQLDIGEVNLELATGLPGSEELDVPKYVAKLDRWAEVIALGTQRMRPRFEANPGEFQHSIAYFRMMVFVTVLQRNFGLTYAMEERDREFDCTDSRLHFIHGVLEGHGGTCTTMPVLFVALGRRLGYPLKLVSAQGHFFVRWDDPQGERFNIEATSRGLLVHPDDYYRSWPAEIDPRHIAKGWHLKSHSPHEELAAFYVFRAQCLLDWARIRPALHLAHRAFELTGGAYQSCYESFYAMMTVLDKSSSGFSQYCGSRHDQSRGFVIENNRRRRLEAWEAWAVNEAERETARIRRLHAERKQRGLPYVGDSSSGGPSPSSTVVKEPRLPQKLTP